MLKSATSTVKFPQNFKSLIPDIQTWSQKQCGVETMKTLCNIDLAEVKLCNNRAFLCLIIKLDKSMNYLGFLLFHHKNMSAT